MRSLAAVTAFVVTAMTTFGMVVAFVEGYRVEALSVGIVLAIVLVVFGRGSPP